MNLKFSVDQKAALLAGVNATSSTIILDIDPATLTQDQREYLSAIMKDGHDCTSSNGDDYRSITLLRPDAQGVLDAIAARQSELAARIAEKAKARATRDQKTESEINRARSAPIADLLSHHYRDGWGTKSLQQFAAHHIDEAGTPKPSESIASLAGREAEVEIELSRLATETEANRAADKQRSEEAERIAKERKAAGKIEMRAILEQRAADMLAVYDAGRACRDALDVVRRTELSARMAINPSTITDHKTGATDDSICLDAAQFAVFSKLQHAAATLPAHWEVTVATCYAYTHDPEDEAADSDGDVKIGIVAEITATVGGHQVTEQVSL